MSEILRLTFEHIILVSIAVTGAILVFSFVGLVWASAAGDLARYQRPSGAGAASMLTASFVKVGDLPG